LIEIELFFIFIKFFLKTLLLLVISESQALINTVLNDPRSIQLVSEYNIHSNVIYDKNRKTYSFD